MDVTGPHLHAVSTVGVCVFCCPWREFRIWIFKINMLLNYVDFLLLILARIELSFCSTWRLTMRDLLLQVYPHGSTDTLPFATMGSGSLAAMSVFESRYKEDLTVNVFSTCAFTILVIVFVLRGFTDNMILSYNVLPIWRHMFALWSVEKRSQLNELFTTSGFGS
jgi:hypothetical protein